MKRMHQDYCWERVAGLPGNPYFLGRDALAGLDCLFAWFRHGEAFSPNAFPLAFGIMASLVRMNGGKAALEAVDPENPSPEAFRGRRLICFFPQAADLAALERACRVAAAANPAATIALLNSEQHQHEMLLCSPKAEDLGRALMQRLPEVAVCLLGEAEYAFVRLCRSVLAGAGLERTPCALYRDGGQVALTEAPQRAVDFSFLPFPARDGLEDSLGPDGVNTASVRVQSSRGCTATCLYCAESRANLPERGRRKAWIGKPLELFVGEIRELSKRYGAYYFNINDSSFEDPGAGGLERMRAFCRAIASEGIAASFKIHLRVETLAKLDDADLDLLKRAGVDVIIMGVESGLASELLFYRKRGTVEAMLHAVDRLDRDGRFFPLLGHMMFSPVLHLEDLPVKTAFLRRIRRGWDYLDLSNNLLVHYGTAYHDALRREGLEAASGEVLPVVPYRYRDPRVATVATDISGLRGRIAAVMPLQHLLYDACNLLSRAGNPANRHLQAAAPEIEAYRQLVALVQHRLEDAYLGYMEQVIESVSRDAARPSDAGLAGEVAKLHERLDQGHRELLERLRAKGLPTGRLCLATWLSVINVAKNTSGGQV
jgi:hypothetical protein